MMVSDRYDRAAGPLEKARKPRPNDPLLSSVLVRMYLMVAQTDEKLAEVGSLLEESPTRTNGAFDRPSTGESSTHGEPIRRLCEGDRASPAVRDRQSRRAT